MGKLGSQCPDCGGKKVYSNTVLTSNPPQYPWICRQCLTEGRDQEHSGCCNEYAELKAAKEKAYYAALRATREVQRSEREEHQPMA